MSSDEVKMKKLHKMFKLKRKICKILPVSFFDFFHITFVHLKLKMPLF